MKRAILMGLLLVVACARNGQHQPPGTEPPVDDSPAHGGARDGYPKLAAWTEIWDHNTEIDRQLFARFDVLAVDDPVSSALDDVLARNPDAQVWFMVMPQTVSATDWYRDSWYDHVRRYAVANDWILRHDNGEEAFTKGWSTYWRWMDFTTRCPRGEYWEPTRPELDSRGLTFADWLAEKFIPWIVETRSPRIFGFWWEVIAERPFSGWFHFNVPSESGGLLDWDRDGVADFQEGGWQMWEAFAASWDSVASPWIEQVRSRLGYDFPIIAGGDAQTHELRYYHGFKNEDFLHRNRWGEEPWNWDWWDEFYLTNTERPRRGYVYQRDHALGSWDLSFNELQWRDDFANPETLRKWVRYALGTTLLGDGYFILRNTQTADPIWLPEFFDLELGVRGDPFEKDVHGADTLYSRDFYDSKGKLTGRVTVNPQRHPVAGVPAEDAVIEQFD